MGVITGEIYLKKKSFVRKTYVFNKFTSLQLFLIILYFTESLLQNYGIHFSILSMKLSTLSIQNTSY